MRSVAAVIALVACVHAGLWALTREEVSAPDVTTQLASVSYAPFGGAAHPDSGQQAQEAQIRADLKKIAPLTRSIRTYSSTGGVELVPGIAQEFGLKVTVGAWIDKYSNRNEREIANVIDLAKRHSNVKSIVVGNETVYRDDMKVDELIKLIQRVKKQTSVPVTTGEIYSVWLEHPELASAVDYIAAHILPYWEGFSEEQAVDQAILIYDRLRENFPGKRIVIAEFGWPSAGYNYKNAHPGRLTQAKVLRTFISKAEAYGLDYNIIEAVDQPWKTNEGGVGPYWGMLDASRDLKFNWTGPLSTPDHWQLAGVALLLGVLLSLPVLGIAGATAAQAALLSAAAHGVGAWLAVMVGFWTAHYFVVGAAFAYWLGVILLIPLLVIALARVDEIAMIAFGRKPARLIKPAAVLPAAEGPALVPDAPALPKVSIHIPAYREPPEMLRQTLDAISRLEYPNFECVVVINNTPDPTLWQPIAEHCKALGDRFKFVNVEKLTGFKAGALRVALEHTAQDAEIIGVIDADYVVQPDWLRDLVPAFADADVGLIQAPQDHRDGERSLMHHAMNREYAGFFDIGMVQRNEYNAIIVHGTMCLIRRSALAAVGGWSSDTICEDTDLGLNMLEKGWKALYTNKRYGHGLLPDNFDAYKKQRHRWAYGGLQIIKKHWRAFLPGESRLTNDQKREFALGWLNWLGAESFGVVVALLNIAWVPVVSFLDIAVPDRVLTLPIIATFALSVIHFVTLYRLRVAVPARHLFGAVFAAMSLQWTVARAVGHGIVKDHFAFVRTAKGGHRRTGDYHAFWEAIIGGMLILGAIVLVQFNFKEIREINLFAAVLVIQSIPFLAAAALGAIEHTRFNDFVYWRGLEAKLAELLPVLRPAIAEAPAAPTATPAAPPPVNKNEPVP